MRNLDRGAQPSDADLSLGGEEQLSTGAEAVVQHSLYGRAARRLARRKLALVCLAFIAVFYAVGLFAPWIAPYGYSEQNLDLSFHGPSIEHPLGTDRLGRDVLSRNIYAARTTVVVTLATLATGFVILPLTLGMLAGYRSGLTDSAIMRTGEILASLPGLPMLVLINVALRPRFVGWVEDIEGVVGWTWMSDSGFADYFIIFLALSLFGWVGGARLIRTQVLTLRTSDFVRAAEMNGASTARILFVHLLPNVLPFVILGVSASLGAIAAAEVGLTFLGVGIQPPNPSFGSLINDGVSRSVLENHPQLLLVPGVIVGLSILAFNLLGDMVNDVLDPRAR
jgi:ABC-type dipeptide/oligopeptide/nickel transport system permease subunit